MRRPAAAPGTARRCRPGARGARALDPQAAPRRNRRGAAAPRRDALQLCRRLHAGAHPRRGTQDLHPGLLGVLRTPLVRLRGRAAGRLRHGPHVCRERRGVRHRTLRGPMDPRAALVAHGAERRPRDLQPLGLARGGRQARLPAAARRPAVGPHDLGLRLLLGRLRRILDRPGLRRQRPDRRERRDPARRRTLLARRAAHNSRRGPRAAGLRTPAQHLLPAQRVGHGEHRHRDGDPRRHAPGQDRPRHRPHTVRSA